MAGRARRAAGRLASRVRKAQGKLPRGVVPSRRKVYGKLREKGFTATAAAKIANKGHDHASRSEMAKKAARTRKRT